MSRTDTCDMKKMGDGAISPNTDVARPPSTDVVRSSTTHGASSSTTDGARTSNTDGARSPATGGARPPATGNRHACEASAGCSVSACHMDRLPAELLQQVLSHLSLWEQLNAELVSRRWKEAVHALLRCRQQLDLRAEMPGGLRDGTLSRVLRLMPSLRVLRFYDAEEYCSYNTLDIVASHCTRLAEVDLVGLHISEDSLRRLCLACPNLEKVKLFGNASESGVRVMLQHLPGLRTLELDNCYSVTGQCFALLPASLRRLSVAWCHGLRSEALLHVGTRCPQLRELDMSKVVHLEPAHVSAALSGYPLLERLTARCLKKPLERHLPPGGLPGLRHLDVSYNADGVTDSTLRQLPDLLPALQTLNISECQSVTEEGLLHVCRLKQLVSLDLSFVRGVTDAVLDRLHELPLKEIHLAEEPSEILRAFFGTSGFTQQGLVRLVLACKSLRLLNVSGHPYTLITAMVDQLMELLPSSRSVTLWVADTVLANLPPLPPGPLRLQKWTIV